MRSVLCSAWEKYENEKHNSHFGLWAHWIPVHSRSGIHLHKDKHYGLTPMCRGPDRESGLIREVRHRLVMLPYYGVFDDIGFTVNGTAVAVVGQVRQPVLKTRRRLDGPAIRSKASRTSSTTLRCCRFPPKTIDFAADVIPRYLTWGCWYRGSLRIFCGALNSHHR